MEGKQLKEIIRRSGMTLKEFADRMGILPQSLNSIFNSSDIKSGTVEKVAELLGVPVSCMYADGDAGKEVENAGEHQPHYDALKKRDEQIDRLLTIIERMQENGNRRADY